MLIGGRIILSFRDYVEPLNDVDRFTPVRGDQERILTCFLEYFPDKVRVTDLLHEKVDNHWIQKVSSYYKVRLTKDVVLDFMAKANFVLTKAKTAKGMVTIVGEKGN